MKEKLKEFFYFLLHGRARAISEPVSELERTFLEMGGNNSVVILKFADKPEEPEKPKPEQVGLYVPGETVINKNEPFQISEKQYEKLKKGAERAPSVWSIPLPRPEDDKQLRLSLTELGKEIEELLAIGLIRDVTDTFHKEAADILKNYNRETKFYAMTEEAELLFQEEDAYLDGDEVKYRKRAIQ